MNTANNSFIPNSFKEYSFYLGCMDDKRIQLSTKNNKLTFSTCFSNSQYPKKEESDAYVTLKKEALSIMLLFEQLCDRAQKSELNLGNAVDKYFVIEYDNKLYLLHRYLLDDTYGIVDIECYNAEEAYILYKEYCHGIVLDKTSLYNGSNIPLNGVSIAIDDDVDISFLYKEREPWETFKLRYISGELYNKYYRQIKQRIYSLIEQQTNIK